MKAANNNTTKAAQEEEEDTFLEASGNSESKFFSQLKSDNELFHDEDAVPQKVISVKRYDLPNNGEDWEFYEDDELTLTLKGARFSSSERAFFRSVDGFLWLLSQYKLGKTSVVKMKDALAVRSLTVVKTKQTVKQSIKKTVKPLKKKKQ